MIVKREYPDFEIVIAETGLEAIKKVETWIPDIIFLLNSYLRDISALTVCEKLRSNPALHNTKILISSAYISKEIENMFLEAGANIFLPKPFNLVKINNFIAECANEKEQRFLGSIKRILNEIELKKGIEKSNEIMTKLLSEKNKEHPQIVEIIKILSSFMFPSELIEKILDTVPENVEKINLSWGFSGDGVGALEDDMIGFISPPLSDDDREFMQKIYGRSDATIPSSILWILGVKLVCRREGGGTGWYSKGFFYYDVRDNKTARPVQFDLALESYSPDESEFVYNNYKELARAMPIDKSALEKLMDIFSSD
jgi:CheY-like chemotaxis protein